MVREGSDGCPGGGVGGVGRVESSRLRSDTRKRRVAGAEITFHASTKSATLVFVRSFVSSVAVRKKKFLRKESKRANSRSDPI